MASFSARVRLALALGGVVLLGATAAPASAQFPTTNDPRAALAAGLDNAGVAQRGLELLANRAPSRGATRPTQATSRFVNSDLAFQGDYAFVGGFNGFQVWNIANPAAPVLRSAVVCPGGQGDVSVYGNLLFVSVEETRAKKDCTVTPAATTATRFRGVRIFDISNISAPCRSAGSRPAVVRIRTRWSRARTTRAPSTSTSPARPGRSADGRPDDVRPRPGDEPEPVAVADRGHQGAAREPGGRRDRQ